MRALCRVALLLTLRTFVFAAPLADPQTSPASLTEAHSKIEHGDLQGALAILDALHKAQPETKGLARERGLIDYRSGKLVEAEAAFAQAIDEDPGDKESVQLRGLTLYRLGRPADAIPFLEKVREWTPDGNADANYVLGLCYLNSQRRDDARAAFALQYGVGRDSGAAHLLTGRMLLLANLPEAALAEGRKAMESSPDLPLLHFMLGEVYLGKSNAEAALGEFSQEQRLNPGYAPVYDRLADLYTRLGKYQEAQEALTRALSLDRSSTGPFIQMGKVLLKRNDPQSAAMYLQHAEKMDPGNYITHTLLGQAYRSMGRGPEASQEFQTASKIQAAGELKLPQ